MGWISVEDKLPELGSSVVICSDKSKNVFIAWTSSRNKGVFLDEPFGIRFIRITHWMPLPEPPVR